MSEATVKKKVRPIDPVILAGFEIIKSSEDVEDIIKGIQDVMSNPVNNLSIFDSRLDYLSEDFDKVILEQSHKAAVYHNEKFGPVRPRIKKKFETFVKGNIETTTEWMMKKLDALEDGPYKTDFIEKFLSMKFERAPANVSELPFILNQLEKNGIPFPTGPPSEGEPEKDQSKVPVTGGGSVKEKLALMDKALSMLQKGPPKSYTKSDIDEALKREQDETSEGSTVQPSDKGVPAPPPGPGIPPPPPGPGIPPPPPGPGVPPPPSVGDVKPAIEKPIEEEKGKSEFLKLIRAGKSLKSVKQREQKEQKPMSSEEYCEQSQDDTDMIGKMMLDRGIAPLDENVPFLVSKGYNPLDVAYMTVTERKDLAQEWKTGGKTKIIKGEECWDAEKRKEHAKKTGKRIYFKIMLDPGGSASGICVAYDYEKANEEDVTNLSLAEDPKYKSGKGPGGGQQIPMNTYLSLEGCSIAVKAGGVASVDIDDALSNKLGLRPDQVRSIMDKWKSIPLLDQADMLLEYKEWRTFKSTGKWRDVMKAKPPVQYLKKPEGAKDDDPVSKATYDAYNYFIENLRYEYEPQDQQRLDILRSLLTGRWILQKITGKKSQADGFKDSVGYRINSITAPEIVDKTQPIPGTKWFKRIDGGRAHVVEGEKKREPNLKRIAELEGEWWRDKIERFEIDMPISERLADGLKIFAKVMMHDDMTEEAAKEGFESEDGVDVLSRLSEFGLTTGGVIEYSAERAEARKKKKTHINVSHQGATTSIGDSDLRSMLDDFFSSLKDVSTVLNIVINS